MMSDLLSADWFTQRRRTEPLPYLLAQFLRDAIRQGRISPGQRLPGENEFAEQLGVSRATLREAVRMLLTQGVLERRHGVGTFVTNSTLLTIEEGLEALTSTTELIRQHGYEPGTAEFRSEVIPASPQLAVILNAPPATPVLHISRTRTANHEPVIQAEEYVLVSELGAAMLPQDAPDWSLYNQLSNIGKPVVSAVCKLKAVAADAYLSHQLKLPQRSPLLQFRQTHFTAHHLPILYCENYHNTAIIEFQVLRRS